MLLKYKIKEACSTCEKCINVGEHEGKRTDGQPGLRWEGNIKMNLTGKGYDDVDSIRSA
jgi:hypothetical protein